MEKGDIIIGELSALACAASGAATITLFTYVSDRLGVYVQTLYRLFFGLALVALAQYLTSGVLFERYETSRQLYYVIASGLIGFTIGDLFLFRSSSLLGPRLGVLIFILYVPMATLLAVLFLDEKMGIMDIVGMVVTLGGVVLVVMAKRGGGENHFVPKRLSLGIFFGVMGALCNALGLVFSKIGMVGSETSAMNTLFVRLASAAIASWVLGFFAGFSQKAIKEWPGWKMTGLIFAGALCGPLLSVWLALIAIRYTYTGVATTIMALAPIMVIPFAQITHKEKITWQMILGTVIAIAGVAILFLVD